MDAIIPVLRHTIRTSVKKAGLLGLGLLPFPKKGGVYCPRIPCNTDGGPGRFLWNLSEALVSKGTLLESRFLSRAQAALFLSNSPGDLFLDVCVRKKIKTVLRVDGFYVPTVFDGRSVPYRMKRVLDIGKRAVNERMEKDIERCDEVVFQSVFSKQLADKFLCRRDQAYSIIYNGVDVEAFTPVRKSNDDLKIVMLGTWRDIDLVLASLESYRLIRKEIPARLTVIGPMSVEVQVLYEDWLEQNESCRADITRAGHLDVQHLPPVLARHDVALHLKSGDCCPNAVLECLACGIPVVCQRYGGTSELVQDAGFIVDEEPYVYPPAFSARVAALVVEGRELLSEKGAVARARAESQFSLEHMAANYLSVLLG